MTIHVLVEGASELAFFERWGPRVRSSQKIKVHPHQGKGALPKSCDERPNMKARGLLDQLVAKLKGFSSSLDPTEDGVLILVDADNDEVGALAARIRRIVDSCAPRVKVVVSLAVEETEAFYLGDLRALKLAYPSADMKRARSYIPDSICGTWELFGEIIGDGGANKVAWGESMGERVTTEQAESRSPSFRALLNELENFKPIAKVPVKARRFRHSTRGARRGDGKR